MRRLLGSAMLAVKESLMRRIGVGNAAMAVGAVAGVWHLMWVIFVAIGWAKPLLDFILALHFVKVGYELAPFDVVTAGSLVAITFCVGALFGAIFAIVWNFLTSEEAPEWARDTRPLRGSPGGLSGPLSGRRRFSR